MRIVKGIGLAGMLLLSSCTLMTEQAAVATAPGATNQVTTSAGGVSQTNAQEVIPVIPGTSTSAEQQALINEINRTGQVTPLPDRNDVAPQAVQVEGDDVVELNYEQVDLRL
ncbi:MAG: hypothetical protein RL120_03610, partial [Gammaproteobacteria bacterium]